MEHGLRGTFPLDLDSNFFFQQFPISAALVPVLQSFIFLLFNYRSHRKKNQKKEKKTRKATGPAPTPPYRKIYSMI